MKVCLKVMNLTVQFFFQVSKRAGTQHVVVHIFIVSSFFNYLPDAYATTRRIC